MTDDGAHPKAIEKNPSGIYMLMTASSNWETWKAAWNAALEWRASAGVDALESIDSEKFQALANAWNSWEDCNQLLSYVNAWGAQQRRNGYAEGYDEKLSLLEKRTEQLREAEAQLAAVASKEEALIQALVTIAAQDSGKVGSTALSDCMASVAHIALRNAGWHPTKQDTSGLPG